MPIDERWDKLTDEDWTHFANCWLRQQRDGVQDGEQDYDGSATMMSFTARPEQQWKFIVAAVDGAETDEELALIAAGALEHILATHGDKYINEVEQRAAIEPKFARAVTGVWRHGMPDDLWNRVEAIQKKTPPLPH